MARTLIVSVRTGTCTKNGTDWPVTDTLHRERMPGRRPTWIITRGICDGIADGVSEYSKFRLALEEWGKLGHSVAYARTQGSNRRTLCESCHGSGKVSRHICGCERQVECDSCNGSGYMS